MKIEDDQNTPKENSGIASILKNSVLFKLVIITVLMLLLLIPTSMIKDIIKEREQLSEVARDEVSEKWAGSQQLNGPILSIPLIYVEESSEELKQIEKTIHILPENLKISGDVTPQKLKRGIYEVVVYKSDLKVSGNFNLHGLIDTTHLKSIQYKEAFVTIGISDLRGIKNRIKLHLNDTVYEVKPGSKIPNEVGSGVIAQTTALDAPMNIDFNYQLNLNGSKEIEFIPSGGNTEVDIRSNWQSPSFKGKFLPDSREVGDSGFTANWKILQLNKDLPSAWINENIAGKMQDAAFGFDLIFPLDDYQKSIRSAKYAVLTIALTFLTFFLVEITNKRKIHPFQYALVGLAICLFYILLVAVSEHSNFNWAYLISGASVIGLIVLYSLSIFHRKRLSALLLLVMTALFGFLFVTLQMEDFALLMGSVGLLIIFAITMYSTRNIDWYNINVDAKNE